MQQGPVRCRNIIIQSTSRAHQQRTGDSQDYRARGAQITLARICVGSWNGSSATLVLCVPKTSSVLIW